MKMTDRWLSQTTWRTISLQWHAGVYTATAYAYPDLNEQSRQWVFEGHGLTIDEALSDLGDHLARLEAGDETMA